MGLLDIFKRKNNQTTSEQKKSNVNNNELVNFDCYYLYGLTDNPFRQSLVHPSGLDRCDGV